MPSPTATERQKLEQALPPVSMRSSSTDPNGVTHISHEGFTEAKMAWKNTETNEWTFPSLESGEHSLEDLLKAFSGYSAMFQQSASTSGRATLALAKQDRKGTLPEEVANNVLKGEQLDL